MSEKRGRSLSKRGLSGTRVLFFISTSTIGICLVAYGYIGTFMRLSGDDYCYSAYLSQGTFWQAQVNSYLQVSTYNANRFSLTLFSGLASLFPPVVNGFLPGLVIVLWFIGLSYASKSLFHALEIRVPWWFCLVLAGFIEFVTFYQAPDISQSLYWRSGMLPYTLPILTNTYLFGLLLNAWRKERSSWVFVMITIVLSFIGGGFSEVGTIFQIGWLGLMWLRLWLVDRRSGIKTRAANKIFLVVMSATILALLLLLLSPTNQMRRAVDSSLPGLFEIVEIVGVFSIKFFARTFRDQPIPTVYSMLVPFLIGMVAFGPLQIRLRISISAKRVLTWIPAFLFGYIFLVASSSVPFAYIQSAVPEPRAQIIARFVMTLSLVGIGISIGLLAAQLMQSVQKPFWRMVRWAAVLVLLLAAMYPLRAAGQIFQDAPRYQKWAYYWDMRDQEIQMARAQGIMDVQVVQIDHIIDRVGDLSADPAYWYNTCAAMYYQVSAIRADLPGWDQ